MAERLPGPLKKREVLYGAGTPAERLTALGRAALEAGRDADALDFFCEAADEQGLAEMKRRAIEAGDAFHLAQIARIAPKAVSRADWDALARRAEALGKHEYAKRARRPDPTAALEPEEKRALEEEAQSAEKGAAE